MVRICFERLIAFSDNNHGMTMSTTCGVIDNVIMSLGWVAEWLAPRKMHRKDNSDNDRPGGSRGLPHRSNETLG